MADDGRRPDDDAGSSDESRDRETPADVKFTVRDEPISDDELTDGGAEEDVSVAGTFSPQLAVKPQLPDVEHVVFVALGVYVGIIAISQIFAGVGILSLERLVALTLVIAIGTALLYTFFVRTNPESDPDT